MKKLKTIVVAVALIAALVVGTVLATACGKSVEPGNYSATVTFDKEYSTGIDYGVKVTINVDETGTLWDLVAEAPDAEHNFTNQFTWTVMGSKFTAQFIGEWTVFDFAKIEVGLDDDGFPLTPGDGSTITHPSKELTVLYDSEATCAVVILCIQKIVEEQGWA